MYFFCLWFRSLEFVCDLRVEICYLSFVSCTLHPKPYLFLSCIMPYSTKSSFFTKLLRKKMKLVRRPNKAKKISRSTRNMTIGIKKGGILFIERFPRDSLITGNQSINNKMREYGERIRRLHRATVLPLPPLPFRKIEKLVPIRVQHTKRSVMLRLPAKKRYPK